jgi:hypothetical protein
MKSRYPGIDIVYQHITSNLYFYNDTGTTLLYTCSVVDGANGKYSGSTPTKASTAQYTYTFANGWATVPGGPVVSTALKNVTSDRQVYAVFTSTLRTYTVTWKNGSTTLETDSNVPYGTVPTYNGSTPVYNGDGNPEDYEFNGWEPAVGAITGDTTYTAKWKDNSYAYVKLIDRSISGEYVNDVVETVGNYAFNACSKLTTVNFPAATRIGDYAFQNCGVLTTANIPAVTYIGVHAFNACSKLTTVNFPAATSIGVSAFYNCTSLTTADFSAAITNIGSAAFYGCSNLTALILRSETMAKLTVSNTFERSSIASGTGYIYVPSALLDSYKTANVWKAYANQFRSIEDYPEITGGENA